MRLLNPERQREIEKLVKKATKALRDKSNELQRDPHKNNKLDRFKRNTLHELSRKIRQEYVYGVNKGKLYYRNIGAVSAGLHYDIKMNDERLVVRDANNRLTSYVYHAHLDDGGLITALKEFAEIHGYDPSLVEVGGQFFLSDALFRLNFPDIEWFGDRRLSETLSRVGSSLRERCRRITGITSKGCMRRMHHLLEEAKTNPSMSYSLYNLMGFFAQAKLFKPDPKKYRNMVYAMLDSPHYYQDTTDAPIDPTVLDYSRLHGLSAPYITDVLYLYESLTLSETKFRQQKKGETIIEYHDYLAEVDNFRESQNYALPTHNIEPFEFEGYTVALPKDSHTLRDAGIQLHNCLFSYADRILTNKCVVVLLSKGDKYRYALDLINGEIGVFVANCNRGVSDDILEKFTPAINRIKKGLSKHEDVPNTQVSDKPQHTSLHRHK